MLRPRRRLLCISPDSVTRHMRLSYPLMSLLVRSAAQGQACAPPGADAASRLTLAMALQSTFDCRLGDLDERQRKDFAKRLRQQMHTLPRGQRC